MEKIYFTVGPAQAYPTIKSHIINALPNDIISLSHTGKDFLDIYRKVSSNLRQLFDIPDNYHILFTGSSTESMERIIASTVERKSFHIITGGFAKKFHKTAVDLGKMPTPFEISLHDKINFSKIDIPSDIELLCITENDTSTGMQLPISEFKLFKNKNPNLLIAVDIVSSIPYTRLDYSEIDMAFFSVQKGLGMPPGLGVLIVNDRSIEKAKFIKKNGISIGSHFNLISLAEKEQNFKTPATPNVFYIYLLSKITEDFLNIGINKIRQETEEKAKYIYDFFDNHPVYKQLVYKDYRSLTTPVIDVCNQAEEIFDFLAERGLIVSKGYSTDVKKHIRIANFPAIKMKHIQQLLCEFSKFA